VLSEPSSKQSDASAIELQLRAASKQAVRASAQVRSIDHAHTNPGKVAQWIRNVEMVHRRKPPASVHFTGVMPDVDELMQTWPAEVEALLNEGGGEAIPDLAAMDLSLEEQVRMVCGMLDIPVRPGRKVESLHLLFTLFAAFRDNQHFQSA